MLSVTVEASLEHSFSYDVEEDSVLKYEFKCSDLLYFSLVYEDAKANRNMTWTKEASSTYLCPRKGRIQLIFDNSTSWLRGTKVDLEASVQDPLEPGLERPIIVHVPPNVSFSAFLEERLYRVKSEASPTTRQIIDSGARLLVFDDEDLAQTLTGRPIDHWILSSESETEFVALLSDLHPFLLGKKRNKQPLKVILGTMTFDNVGDKISAAIASSFFNFSSVKSLLEVDTAFAYGKTEAIIGRAITPKFGKDMVLATKVNPWDHSGKSFSEADIRTQLEQSLKDLKVTKVKILYLHQPDSKTPLEETCRVMNKLHQEGKFEEFGLSNFAAWQVVFVYHTCRANGWVLPTVYQGMYNVLTRAVEPELLPALRAHGIRFYAYNPLAGGLLTERYASIEAAPKHGRFAKGTVMGKRYLERFWHPSYFKAVQIFRDACKTAKVPVAEAAFRWLNFHSDLCEQHGDGVILGASSVTQIDGNLHMLSNNEPLPQLVLEAANKAWDVCKADCPSYWRK